MGEPRVGERNVKLIERHRDENMLDRREKNMKLCRVREKLKFKKDKTKIKASWRINFIYLFLNKG